MTVGRLLLTAAATAVLVVCALLAQSLYKANAVTSVVRRHEARTLQAGVDVRGWVYTLMEDHLDEGLHFGWTIVHRDDGGVLVLAGMDHDEVYHGQRIRWRVQPLPASSLQDRAIQGQIGNLGDPNRMAIPPRSVTAWPSCCSYAIHSSVHSHKISSCFHGCGFCEPAAGSLHGSLQVLTSGCCP